MSEIVTKIKIEPYPQCSQLNVDITMAIDEGVSIAELVS